MSGVPKGRGRGRGARAGVGGETSQTSPPGATSPSTETPTDVGRRAAVGRRAEVQPAAYAAGDKPERSPPHTGSPGEAAEKMAALELISLATKPGYGTLGRKYRMFANHFEMAFNDKVLTVNRYQIDVSHPKLKLTRDDNRPIFWKCLFDNHLRLGLPNVDALHKVAYDGVSACFTLDPLNISLENNETAMKFEVETTVSKCDRPMRCSVSFQSTGPVLVDLTQVTNPSLSDRTTTPIQVVDILLRQYRSQPYSELSKSFYPFRSSIFMIPGSPNSPGGVDLGGGREVWKGLFTSAHVVEGHRALINMDVDHTAFYKFSTGNGNGNGKYYVIQFMCDVLNDIERRQNYRASDLRPETALPQTLQNMFDREIRGMRICIDYKKKNAVNEFREYRVIGTDKSAAACMFTTADGTQKSVADYFQELYGPLKFPRLFTLKVGSKKRPINLPIEHCFLAKNQKVTRKLNENQTANMIRSTCMAPADRKRSIEQMVTLARFNEDPFLKNFGIRVNPNMMQLEGRVLPNPGFQYGGNNIIQPRDGVWRASGARFHRAAGAKGVAAVCFARPPNAANEFVGGLMDVCRRAGMDMPDGGSVFFHLEQDQSASRCETAFRACVEGLKKKGLPCDLIIVLLQQKGGSLYADVKRTAEIQMGIMTQCVVYKTIERSSADTLANISFKINMKLGGINCALTARETAVKYILNVPTMVLGIDVTHPGPLEKKKPSVASVVGSMDMTQMRYAASIKVQKKRDEHLVYLADKVTERLMAFYKATQQKPERIIVYRDGVSEGQFQQVLREELRGVREACVKVDASYHPKITFIVVQKRHHTRLFPADPNDGCGKAKNVYPGTVIDRNIVHPDEFVFYLCSHAGIQGTSRPTRYYVLHDESNFTADDVQMISYYLCHCFSRCTRAVSIPAPVYYADLACTRARSHLAASFGDTLSDSASTISGGEPGQSSSISEEELINATTVTEILRKDMYFT